MANPTWQDAVIPDQYKQYAGGLGQEQGWVYVRGPDGNVLSVPPNSPEAQDNPHVTLGSTPNPGTANSSPTWSDQASGAPAPTSGLSTTGQPQGLDRNAAVNDFYRMMMNPNDPQLLAAQKAAQAGSNANSQAAGLGGGLAASSAAKVGQDSYNGLAFQRQTAGINALTQGMNYDRGLQAQVFGQNQSNQINSANQLRGDVNTGIAAAGQVGAGLAKNIGKGGGGMTAGTDGEQTNNFPDASPYPDPSAQRGAPSDLSGGMSGGE